MKKIFFALCLLFAFTLNAQQRLLTKKIVYTVQLTDNKVQSSVKQDSVVYDYKVNKRFFWEAMDGLISDLKKKKAVLYSFRGDTLVWDTVMKNLTKSLTEFDLKKYSAKDVQNVLENEIRAIRFEEEWTYDEKTMLINKQVNAFCPVIQRDSVTLAGDELQAVTAFAFELGWIRADKNSKISKDTLLISRNLHYTMPIYNTTPYRWWDSNLEAEYSVPFFDRLLTKTSSKEIASYESPDADQPYTAAELEKRRKHTMSTTIVNTLPDNNVTESDTVISLTYSTDDIDNLRFGEEIYYDRQNNMFFKHTNYLAPVVRVYGSDGQFHGFYPLFYIRKD
ncbi:MAG: hypothetical protein IJ250_01815 [Bacteroidales bacterium]|nr:hypothetical protein [Bacteroidales bacterium]